MQRLTSIRGNAKTELQQFNEAFTDFDKAIELNPEVAAAYYNRGRANRLLGKEEEAITDFKKANELDPTVVIQEATKKKTEEITENLKEITEKTEEIIKFQNIIEEALQEYNRSKEVWFKRSKYATGIVFFCLLLIHTDITFCPPDFCKNTSGGTEHIISKISISAFLIAVYLFILRQYTNANRLAIETNNRLIASKLFANISFNDKIEDSLYPPIIKSIIDSPYNQQDSSSDNSLIQKISEILKLSQNK